MKIGESRMLLDLRCISWTQQSSSNQSNNTSNLKPPLVSLFIDSCAAAAARPGLPHSKQGKGNPSSSGPRAALCVCRFLFQPFKPNLSQPAFSREGFFVLVKACHCPNPNGGRQSINGCHNEPSTREEKRRPQGQEETAAGS